MSKFIDLTGMRFGRLLVLGIDKEKSHDKIIYWICQCDCGNIVSVRGGDLRGGNTKSCGCLHKENPAKLFSKSNRIEFDTNLGCLRVYFNNCDEYFLCDVEDRDIAEKYCWYKDKIHGYAINKSDKWRAFHRLVMEKYNGDISNFQVDHQNHNVIDNRRFNLRLCTNGENSRNTIGYSGTGYKNIYYESSRNKYVFNIMIDGKIAHKRLNTLDEALEYKNNFYKIHPDEFEYNPELDFRNRCKDENIIYPFTFINKENIIKPFKKVNNGV